jgi:hypothetical protein
MVKVLHLPLRQFVTVLKEFHAPFRLCTKPLTSCDKLAKYNACEAMKLTLNDAAQTPTHAPLAGVHS